MRLIVVTLLAVVLGGSARAQAQYHYHPLAWMSAEQVVCVSAPTQTSRAQLDEHLIAARRGDLTAPPLELIASCAVPRREVSQALNEGGLVRHRAGDFDASSALLTRRPRGSCYPRSRRSPWARILSSSLVPAGHAAA